MMPYKRFSSKTGTFYIFKYDFFKTLGDRETIYGAQIMKNLFNWGNIQFKIYFLTKNEYFSQNDTLRAIYLKYGHF